jgi:N-ethylmaleimide reductase
MRSTYLAAAKLLDEFGIGNLPIAEADWDDAPPMPAAFKEALRLMYTGVMIYSGHYVWQKSGRGARRGWADLIGFAGRLKIKSNRPGRSRCL